MMAKSGIRRAAVAVAGVGAFVLMGWLLPCPYPLALAAQSCGCEPAQAMRCLGSLAFAVIWWVGSDMPMWVPALIMVFSWTLVGDASHAEAFAPFADTMIWQLASIFVLASAAKKTGILERVALGCMRAFGTGYRSQVLAMAVSGLVMTPLIPAIAAKSVLGSTIAMDVADAMGLERDSKGRAGLFLASFAGCSSIFPAILSSSVLTYLARSLMPEEFAINLTWTEWLRNSWLWLVIFLALFLGLIALLYDPKESSLPKSYVEDKLREMGPLSSDAKRASAVLVACVSLWVLEGSVGLSPTQVSLMGALAMFLLGVLDPKELGRSVNWTFLVLIGCILSLGERLVEVGVSAWISTYITAALSTLSNPFVLVAMLFFSTLVVNLVLTSQAVVIMVFMETLVSVLAPAGFSPFLVGFVLMLACNSFVAPYENPTFIAALEAAGGSVRYRTTYLGAWLYVGCSLTACLASIPYWLAIGAIV